MRRNRLKRMARTEDEPTNLEKFLRSGSLDRRSRIIRAVCRLIETKSALSTSLSDIAREAKMTVSHLVYYFRNKEALLDEVFNSFSASLLSQIALDWSEGSSPEERCQLLVDNLFLETIEPRLGSAIIFEMIAYAVHSPVCRLTQQKHSEKFASYLREFFDRTPRIGEFSSEESAAILCSLWIGILVFSFFHRPMTRKSARELFRRVMLHFAGIARPPENRTSRRSNRVKPSPSRKRPDTVVNTVT
jgi:AcrR family transcriptional regulator